MISNPISHPKSDGFDGENPNPTDSDFFYIRHIPKCKVPLPFPFVIPFPQERHVTLRKK
jgi:hypothetical protein